HPSMRAAVSVTALNEYFTFQNIFSDATLFDHIRLLPPGQIMTVDLRTATPSFRTYWDFQFRPEPMTFHDAVEAVQDCFDAAVSLQMISDVPVATCLSGGVDSNA